MEVKYYVCNHCGNIIEMVKDQGVPVMCCGEAMHELKAGVTDAAVEKHVNNPVPVSLLSGDRKPQIRFLGNHHSGSGNLYHKSFRM